MTGYPDALKQVLEKQLLIATDAGIRAGQLDEDVHGVDLNHSRFPSCGGWRVPAPGVNRPDDDIGIAAPLQQKPFGGQRAISM